MYLFVSFIIAFSGNWKHKLIFIPAGLILIHVFNIIRTALLAIIVVYKPGWTDFNHKYTFTATIYIVIFILWVVWVNYFSTSKKTEN
jgi:exosortase family protein XrtF